MLTYQETVMFGGSVNSYVSREVLYLECRHRGIPQKYNCDFNDITNKQGCGAMLMVATLTIAVVAFIIYISIDASQHLYVFSKLSPDRIALYVMTGTMFVGGLIFFAIQTVKKHLHSKEILNKTQMDDFFEKANKKREKEIRDLQLSYIQKEIKKGNSDGELDTLYGWIKAKENMTINRDEPSSKDQKRLQVAQEIGDIQEAKASLASIKGSIKDTTVE